MSRTPKVLAMFLGAVACVTPATLSAEEEENMDKAFLFYGGPRALSGEVQNSLCTQAVELLKSSVFNSTYHPRLVTGSVPERHGVYRSTVHDKYFVVRFPEPRKASTEGGDFIVWEIVIGLLRPDYVSALFTIDDEGRVVTHSKYSGLQGIAIRQSVNPLIQDSDADKRDE